MLVVVVDFHHLIWSNFSIPKVRFPSLFRFKTPYLLVASTRFVICIRCCNLLMQRLENPFTDARICKIGGPTRTLTLTLQEGPF